MSKKRFFIILLAVMIQGCSTIEIPVNIIDAKNANPKIEDQDQAASPAERVKLKTDMVIAVKSAASFLCSCPESGDDVAECAEYAGEEDVDAIRQEGKKMHSSQLVVVKNFSAVVLAVLEQEVSRRFTNVRVVAGPVPAGANTIFVTAALQRLGMESKKEALVTLTATVGAEAPRVATGQGEKDLTGRLLWQVPLMVVTGPLVGVGLLYGRHHAKWAALEQSVVQAVHNAVAELLAGIGAQYTYRVLREPEG